MSKQVLMLMFSTVENVPPVLNEGISLTEQGYSVKLIALRYDKKQPKIETVVKGFEIHRMSLLTRLIFGDDDRFELFRYAEAAARSFLRGLLSRFDLIVAHDLIALPFAYPLSLFKRKPIVYRAHEVWPEQSPNFPRANFWRRLDVFFSKRVDLLVVPEVNRAHIYAAEYGITNRPLVVFNCPRLLSKPVSSPLNELLKGKGVSTDFVVYYQGGLGKPRKIEKLVEALLHTSETVSVALVGKGNDEFEEWLDAFIRDNHLEKRVARLGFIPYGEKLFSIAAGADIGVMFIQDDCRNNSFSATATNKLFEYMMMGLPVIASRLSGYVDMIEGNSIGICVDANDPQEIARGIVTLMENGTELSLMSLRCRSLAEDRYNWETESKKLFESYSKLMK